MLEIGSGYQRAPSSTSILGFTLQLPSGRRQTKMETTSGKIYQPNVLPKQFTFITCIVYNDLAFLLCLQEVPPSSEEVPSRIYL